MLGKKQIGQILLRLEIGLSLSYILIGDEKKLRNEEEFDQPVFFLALGSPREK